MEPVEPVQKNIYQSNTYRKDLSRPHFDDEPRVQEKQEVKDQQSCTSPDVTTVLHTRAYGRFIEIQSNLRRNFTERIKAPIFLEAVLAIEIERLQESQSNLEEKVNPSILKDDFSPRTDRPIHFPINSTSVIRSVKRNQFCFSSIEINKPLPAPVQCLAGQIQVQKPILLVATDQMLDQTQNREWCHQHRQQYHR